jgi:hypothetical protein
MRWISICLVTALILAILAFWGVSALNSPSRPNAKAHMESLPLGIMKMMQDAKNLPEERFDAY